MNVTTAAPSAAQLQPRHVRLGWVVAAVVVAHGAGLWTLQQLDLRRPPTPLTPPEILVQVTLAPPPQATPSPPPAPAPVQTPAPPPPRPPTPVRPAPAPAPAPLAPAAEASADPVPSAPSPAPAAVLAPAAPAPAAPVASPNPRPAPPSPPAPRIELPSTQAEYLDTPPPAYPRLSRRLGEQGKVVLRVLIGTDGKATQAQILTSSGYDRLDQTALTTVLGWRYVPGKRDGVAEAMWFNVPIQFVLE